MLANCPFCGGEVHWCLCYDNEEEKAMYSPNHKGCHRIVCDHCNISVDVHTSNTEETLEELRVNITAKWNQRI